MIFEKNEEWFRNGRIPIERFILLFTVIIERESMWNEERKFINRRSLVRSKSTPQYRCSVKRWNALVHCLSEREKGTKRAD